MLPLDRNKVLGRIKQGGGLDLAHRPCVCHLCLKNFKSFIQHLNLTHMLLVHCLTNLEFFINEIFASIIFSNYYCMYLEKLLISWYIDLILSYLISSLIICSSFSLDSPWFLSGIQSYYLQILTSLSLFYFYILLPSLF